MSAIARWVAFLLLAALCVAAFGVLPGSAPPMNAAARRWVTFGIVAVLCVAVLGIASQVRRRISAEEQADGREGAYDPPADPSEGLFERYMRLAEHCSARHDERRNYEWKISFGYWGILLAGIVEIERTGATVSLAVVSAAAYLFLWLPGLWFANERDKRQAFRYRDVARLLLAGAPIPPAPPPNHANHPDTPDMRRMVWDWGVQVHAAMTLGLVLTFWATQPLVPHVVVSA
jgi:hypothetical protein